ncbi:hypothetical protein KP509_17G053700 [Ceratopteris richardii]|nr:hypothetical protein KP509_17G053700 [Ceratopteris richardii]KAH7373392.1 hypothetical protein KP509_17G053700 [Ceratopteris richardii]
MPFKKSLALSPLEERAKINELHASLGTMTEVESKFCTDACLHRYLIATNWSKKKAGKMIKDTLKWRDLYKPQHVEWEEISKEAEAGKIYRANFRDRNGRTVLVMRPGVENTGNLEGQLRYLVFCMENAITNLPPDQEQMVWLVDFEGWNMSMIPLKTAREIANVLQNHYPERLAYAILYNPPKVVEVFWNVIRPFLDPSTQKKVKFVYANDEGGQKLMESLFDLDMLECAFGGRNRCKFNKDDYVVSMKKDNGKPV